MMYNVDPLFNGLPLLLRALVSQSLLRGQVYLSGVYIASYKSRCPWSLLSAPDLCCIAWRSHRARLSRLVPEHCAYHYCITVIITITITFITSKMVMTIVIITMFIIAAGVKPNKLVSPL